MVHNISRDYDSFWSEIVKIAKQISLESRLLLFFDDSFVVGSSGTTSPASSVSGQVVLGGGNKQLRLLNTFLEACDVKTINSPQLEWNECVDRTKRRYVHHTRDILVAVLKVVSPENAGYLWTALQGSRAVNDELGVEGILHPAQRVYLEAIAETYKNASSWDTRRQILSIMTGTGASLASIREYIPGLTQYRYLFFQWTCIFLFPYIYFYFLRYCRYTVANLHRLQHGIGTPVPTQPATRIRIDEAQLDHFLQFITSPHIVQDLPFGQKCLHLSNGNVLEVPNVIRALIPERIATQYIQYCKEVNFIPFSQRTMLRILSACSATVRKSLQGLDYVAANGATAFDELTNLLQQYSYLVPTQSLERWQGALKNAKLYLKGDFKVNK